MKFKLLVLSLTIFSTAVVFGQFKPNSYYLQDENKSYKLTDETPSSNSISDIITVGDTVWLGTSRGVSLSTDRGITWKNFYGSAAFGDVSISAIGYNKYDGSFWAATAKSVEVTGGSTLPGGQGLRYTTDLGQTWISIPQPVDAPGDSLLIYGINDGVNLPKVRALPVTVTVQNLTYDIAFTPGTVWISSFAGGLRKSTNNGQTWERVLLPSDAKNSLSPTDTVRFALQAVAGAFGPDNNLNHRLFSVISSDSTTLYVGSAGGINKSTDNGISWQKFNRLNQLNPISGNFIVALGYSDSTSTVWGATWRAEGTTEFYGVSSSTNGGEDWLTYLDGERPHNFGFKGNDVITVTDNGALRSPDNGSSWILPGTIIDANSNLSLNTTIFYSAASEGNSIWLGSDDGLAKLEETSGMWSGDWKIFFASQKLSSKNETYAYPNPFTPRLEQLKIKYSTGGKRDNVTIRVFDFGMNYVSTVIQNAERGNNIHAVDGLQSADEGVIDFWDGKDASGNFVPNGVYFYRVEVGSDEPVYGKILVLQ
ncbi:MAG: hypothetical protein IPM56_10550 [Ignavibacteriales bacterium]|nr:MAG: hypothetical protein IPM56_10550 [Ignavibacteriales bacterium]